MEDPTTDVGVMDQLAGGGLVTLRTFRHHDRPHTDPPEERFDLDTVIFTTRGSWSIRGARGWVDVDPDVVVTARAGSTFRAGHREEIPTDLTLEVTYRRETFPIDGLPALSDGAFTRRGVPRTAAIRRLQALLVQEVHDRAPAFELKLDLLALQLLVELARANAGTGTVEQRLPSIVRDGVAAARRHIDEHLPERITLRTLSEVALVSPFHLARAFRVETGSSPHQYVLRARVERAAELLAETDLTVTQVAERVGFVSPSHFSRTFSRRMGLSPSSYRRTLGRPR
jgi:AraC-like DNA-binding protein